MSVYEQLEGLKRNQKYWKLEIGYWILDEMKIIKYMWIQSFPFKVLDA